MTAPMIIVIILTVGLAALCLGLAVYIVALAYEIYSEARKR